MLGIKSYCTGKPLEGFMQKKKKKKAMMRLNLKRLLATLWAVGQRRVKNESRIKTKIAK